MRPPAWGSKVGVEGAQPTRSWPTRIWLTRFWEARYGGVLLREFLVLAAMLWLYRYVRFLAKSDTADAFAERDHV